MILAPTSVVESLITVTNGVTVTYCPLCDQGGAQPTGPPGSGSPPPPPGGETTHTTVYTTVYESLCPTGVTQQTYTITESCTGPTPSWNTDSNHIPPDFTVTVETCHVCEATPVPKTITKPCGCKASEGVTMPPNQPNAAPTPPPGGSPPPPPPPGGNGAPPPTSRWKWWLRCSMPRTTMQG
ncbi:hypothetical protein MRB53_041603 [Persea americana]|nr:hypothetical protein MRB53_041603 [Persea americana]